jgi:ABC-type antimicrobial peptide transport system permease subunit
MFDGSVFQGMLLMSEENFLKVYPSRFGYQYFLIDVAPDRAGELSTLLESRLTGFGFDDERVADRIADFLAVQNTYLSTFQSLGGLGLLLGTFGLATVMLRNVLERRSELALLRAVGFTGAGVAWMVLFENALLLLWGLVAGTVSAIVAMFPHLSSTGGSLPWGSVGALLAGVFAVGMISALFAVVEAIRTPILATLRSE